MHLYMGMIHMPGIFATGVYLKALILQRRLHGNQEAEGPVLLHHLVNLVADPAEPPSNQSHRQHCQLTSRDLEA